MADDSSNANWAAYAGLAADVGDTAVAVAQTRKQFKRQKEAMALQHAMNMDAWRMQNAYNTPQAQMERLQQAGLNPRLIYGSGSGASQPAGPMDVPEVPVQGKPEVSIGDPMYRYLQVRMMDAQYKATVQNMEIAQKRGALMDIEKGLNNLKLFRENLRSKNYKELAQAELDTQKFLTLRSQELFQNERTKGNVMDQLQQMRQKQMTGIDLDNAFKQHRNELSKLGIYTSDHPAFRVLIQAANRMNIDLGELLYEGAQKLKYLLDLGK